MSPRDSNFEPADNHPDARALEDLRQILPLFDIECLIGRGGMGAVYRARQPSLERLVAIKVILPPLGGKAASPVHERFRREARAMARLRHPGIVSVFDFGETDDGTCYLVQDYIEGRDLENYRLSLGGRLPEERAIALIDQILAALGHAHSRGIIHRDIKPSNILIDVEGRARVTDFGLAKSVGFEGASLDPGLTESFAAVGTIDFLAPESLEPNSCPDHRVDLYATGATLYQLLTGNLPRGRFLLPREEIPSLHPKLDDLVTRSLASDPDCRYSTAE